MHEAEIAVVALGVLEAFPVLGLAAVEVQLLHVPLVAALPLSADHYHAHVADPLPAEPADRHRQLHVQSDPALLVDVVPIILNYWSMCLMGLFEESQPPNTKMERCLAARCAPKLLRGVIMHGR